MFENNMSNFPSLAGLNGQSYENKFDYEQYKKPAVLHLLQVPWRSDCKDVVRFEDEDARDAWFTDEDQTRVEYQTAWLRVPQQQINVPLPYERAAHFNYLFVDCPVLPVDASKEPTRLCYFITDIQYAAPSTTTLALTLDVWQTYGYRMDVSSLELTRGHAPMYRSSVTDFLTDPIANSQYLLAPDVSFDKDKNRVCAVTHYPIGSGTKYLVLALPIAPNYLTGIGAGTSTTASAPSYSTDSNRRNGYMDIVSGYTWAWNGYSYPSAALPNNIAASSDYRTLDGCYIYAIPSTNAQAALVALALAAPHVVASAKYCAIIPAAFVVAYSNNNVPIKYTLAGYDWYHIKSNPTVTITDYSLTVANIGLPDYAADIAKLYTSQYTQLEISDQEGNAFTVNIEDIKGDKLKFMADVSLASATLMCNIEATNVGTDNSYSLTWHTLSSDETTTLYGADLSAYCLKWGIPTYELEINAGSLEAARAWADLEVKRLAALNAYHQAVRPANTSRANTVATNATTVTNTGETNTTSYNNTVRSGQTAQWIQGKKDDFSNYESGQIISQIYDLGQRSHQQAYDLTAIDDEYQMYIPDYTYLSNALTSASNMIGALGTGNVMGAVTASVSPMIALTSSQAFARFTCEKIVDKQGATVDYIDDVATRQMTHQARINTAKIEYEDHVTDANEWLANQNNADSGWTSYYNAQRTETTSNSNAQYVNADSVTAAQENLELAQYAAGAALNKAALSLSKIGATTGDNTMDALNRRAFRVRTVTQNDYALRATADYFTKYGYAFGAPIDFTDWLEGGDYCYWLGKNSIIKGDVPDRYLTVLEVMLNNGFTVWDDPDKVGDYSNE